MTDLPANQGAFPFVAVDAFISADQMREVDRLAMEEFGITLLQMMENAGRSLAALMARRFLGGSAGGKRVLILAGGGGNGGGGLACARHLHSWGAQVHVRLGSPDRMSQAAAQQHGILRHMAVTIGEEPTEPLPQADAIADALVGYSLQGAPRGAVAELIAKANDAPAPVISLDIPSGMDASSGATPGAVVRAAATLTLALPKTGLRVPAARPFVGELYLASLGIPPEAYAQPPLHLNPGPLFSTADIVRLW